MRDENREIIKEAMERMSEWDEYDKEDMPETVLEFKELLNDFYETQGKNPKDPENFNTRVKLSEEGEELLTDIAYGFINEPDTDVDYYENLFDNKGDWKTRYNIKTMGDMIQFLNRIKRFKNDRLLREILSSDQIIELFNEGEKKGLDETDIENWIVFEYTGGGKTGDDLYNQIWGAIDEYDKVSQGWNN